MTRYVLGAGFLFFSLAIFVQGLLPLGIPETREVRTTRATRNDWGDVKWVWHAATPYTPLEQLGRAVYQREGCWYCHSQYVRPVAGENQRWGPVSEVGEYAHDRPHLLSTRRIGPDLTREGLKTSDGWHYAHHWEPEMVVPDTVMPDFPWLFRTAEVTVAARDGEPALPDVPGLRALFSYRQDVSIPLYPNPAGVAFASRTDGTPALTVAHLPAPFDRAETWVGHRLTVVVPSEEMRGLVAYLQKLGTNRGAWRDVFEPQTVSASVMSVPQTETQVERGHAVYLRRCVGCHGERGDGNGRAATFLDPRPRDFTVGAFKFRSTPSGSLPTDGDLYRTITRGVRGTAMPSWHELPDKDRLAVIAYIKTLSRRWTEERPEAPIVIGDPPRPSAAVLARGRETYRTAKCWECHGDAGVGDGPSAGQLADDSGFPIRPADLTRAQFKSGPDVRDVFRTLTTGLDGTPMPSFADALSEDDRWALSYYVLSLSAFRDPLTGAVLPLDASTREKLNTPDRAAFGAARLALDPGGAAPPAVVRFFRGIPGEAR
jgi:cytochrome c oxidase cbb3-type subunit I/II